MNTTLVELCQELVDAIGDWPDNKEHLAQLIEEVLMVIISEQNVLPEPPRGWEIRYVPEKTGVAEVWRLRGDYTQDEAIKRFKETFPDTMESRNIIIEAKPI